MLSKHNREHHAHAMRAQINMHNFAALHEQLPKKPKIAKQIRARVLRGYSAIELMEMTQKNTIEFSRQVRMTNRAAVLN